MEPISSTPARRIAAVGIASLCCWLAGLVHFETITYRASDLLWIAPPPPTASFPEAFLALPGALAGAPLALPGAIFEMEWLTQTGLVLGAAFSWYCIGYQVDCARGIVQPESQPAIVRWYLSALIVVSFVALPFGVLSGVNLGVHSCAVGVLLYWAELAAYGIVMFWITLGCYFGWLRFRARRAHKDSLLSLWMH